MNKNPLKKLIVITGATSGIGRAALQALADEGHTVIGIARNEEKAQSARQSQLALNPNTEVTYLHADLSSQSEIRQLAENLNEEIDRLGFCGLDVLVNNAGMVSSWFTLTEDGYELQFAVNHLAAFLLTHLLLPSLQRCEGSRILTVSSGSHRNTRIHWKDIMLRKRYGSLRAYKQSKLANVLFTYELNRRLGADSNLRAYAVDPGLVNTMIGAKGTSCFVNWFWNKRRRGGRSPELAAETIVYLAMRHKLPETDCWYWKGCCPVQPSSYAQREDAAAHLWEISERLCGWT
jgi:retinol dehydrogenase 12